MLQFIDVPWDPRCIDFHRTGRSVMTASKWQVRQKMNRASIERWRNYEEFIAPLLTLAKPTRGERRRLVSRSGLPHRRRQSQRIPAAVRHTIAATCGAMRVRFRRRRRPARRAGARCQRARKPARNAARAGRSLAQARPLATKSSALTAMNSSNPRCPRLAADSREAGVGPTRVKVGTPIHSAWLLVVQPVYGMLSRPMSTWPMQREVRLQSRPGMDGQPISSNPRRREPFDQPMMLALERNAREYHFCGRQCAQQPRPQLDRRFVDFTEPVETAERDRPGFQCRQRVDGRRRVEWLERPSRRQIGQFFREIPARTVRPGGSACPPGSNPWPEARSWRGIRASLPAPAPADGRMCPAGAWRCGPRDRSVCRCRHAAIFCANCRLERPKTGNHRDTYPRRRRLTSSSVGWL